MLIGDMFNDGSNDAICKAAYVRWKLCSDDYESLLWAAKTLVTPLKKTTMPRIEMTSAAMSTCLCKTIKEYGGLNFIFFDCLAQTCAHYRRCHLNTWHVYFILDSTSTMYLMRKHPVALKEFMANRVTGALEVANPDQIYHMRSSGNIADLGTRMNATPADIDLGSEWQCGPSWLKLDFSEWPISQDCTKAGVPQEELNSPLVIAAAMTALASPSIFDISLWPGIISNSDISRSSFIPVYEESSR